MGHHSDPGIHGNYGGQTACVIVVAVTENHTRETGKVLVERRSVPSQSRSLACVEEYSFGTPFNERGKAMLGTQARSWPHAVIDENRKTCHAFM